MLRIGEFSAFSGISIKALRFYDQCGIFRPAQIDPRSGYRYYASEQLPEIRRIAALRELGVPLRAIRQALSDPETLAECLRARRHALAESVHQARSAMARIDEALCRRSFEIPVIARQTPGLVAASLRARLRGYADCDGLLEELAARIPRRAASGRASIWHQCESAGGATLDCEALVLLNRDVEARGAIRLTCLPSQRVASVFYRGDDFAPAYEALSRWLSSSGMREGGPKREIYVTADLTEVQIPLAC